MQSIVSSYSAPGVAARPRLRLNAFALPALVIANFTVCAYLAATLNIWMDEAYSLHTTGDGLKTALYQAIRYENQAPLYFVVLDIWRHIDHSIFFARLFSMLCITGTLLVLPALARECRLPQGWIVAAAAFNPIAIVLAVEVRVYALMVFLATLLTLAFFKGFWHDTGHRHWQSAYFVIALLALYTQYYLAFLLLAQALLLVATRRRSLRVYCFGMAGVVTLFVPLLVALANQLKVNQANSGNHPSLEHNAVELTIALLHYAFPLVVVSHAAWILYGVSAAALLVLGLSRFRFDWRRWLTVPVMICAAAIAMLLVVTRFGSHEINDRYAAFLLTPTLLTVYAFFECLSDPRRRTYAAVYTFAAAIAAGWTLWMFYGAGAKPGDWKRVAAYIEAHEMRGQPVLVFEGSEALPLSQYYSGRNALVPIPGPISFENWDVRQDVLQSQQQIFGALTAAQRRAAYVWLVRFDECTWAGIDYHCELLDQFVKHHYRIISSRQFVHSHVELLQRRR